MVISIPNAEEELKTTFSEVSFSTTLPFLVTTDGYLVRTRKLWGDYVANRTDLFDPYWLEFPPPHKVVLYVLGTLVAIIGILSVVGNGIVCYTFLRSPSLRNQKLFTVNLAFSDLVSPLLTYHMFVISCFNGIWVYSKNWCNYYALVQGYCGLISITSLAAIALERYGAIAAPNSFWMRMSYFKKLLVLIVLWLYCFIIVSPPLYGFGNYVAAGYLVTCCFDYIERDWSTRYFIVYLFCLGLVIPTMVILFSYVKIFQAQKQSEKDLQERLQRRQKALEIAENDTDADNEHIIRTREGKKFIPKGKEKRLAKLMLVVIIVFVIAWTPYAIVALLGQFGSRGAVKPWMAMIPSVFAKSSTLYNPFLYAFKDSRFQRAMKKYLLGKQLPRGQMTDSFTTQTEAVLKRYVPETSDRAEDEEL